MLKSDKEYRILKLEETKFKVQKKVTYLGVFTIGWCDLSEYLSPESWLYTIYKKTETEARLLLEEDMKVAPKPIVVYETKVGEV